MDINEALGLVRDVRIRVRRDVFGISEGDTYPAILEPAITITTGQVLDLLREREANSRG
jgi:hypothetical protein